MADVNLRKLPRVNLSKNQVVCLTKDGSENSSKLDKVYFGSNWSAIKHGYESISFIKKLFGIKPESYIENVDLDSSILIYDKNCNLIDTVCYYHLTSKCGAIHHSGDDRTGDIENDDKDNETISIELSRVNINAKFLVVILNSYLHHEFNNIPYAGFRIYTGELGNPDEILASYRVDNNSDFKGKEAMILGYFYKSKSGWKFKAKGSATLEKSINEIASHSAYYLINNHRD